MKAFTLLEVVATVVVISIVSLLSYTFITASAEKSSAQTALLNVSAVVAAQQVHASATGQFTPNPDDLSSPGRSVSITSSSSTSESVVSIAVSDQDTLVAAVLASDGTCFATTVSSLTSAGVSEAEKVDEPCLAAAHLPAGEVAVAPG